MGVKVSRIVGLADDIKLNLATPDIRIEAPIPGKAAVGIEVPNKENQAVMLREILQSQEFSGCKIKAFLCRRQGYCRKACCYRYCQNAAPSDRRSDRLR